MSSVFRALFFTVAVAASALPACQADESVLDAVFRCDPQKGDAQCGTDEDGRPMTCYVGSAQLGGEAFCTKSCDYDPDADPDTPFYCTSSGALLERCRPGASSTCPSPLNCYRTDAMFDRGLCLWVPVCPYVSDESVGLDDGQCNSPYPICAGNLLRELAAGTALEGVVQTNNLHCVSEPPCSSFRCSGGALSEACPSDFYESGFGLPVTCAAVCDRFTCPPNFTCAGTSDTPGPPVCLPGVLGMRCTSSEDCITGDCFDTGAGFSVCALDTECTTDSDCSIFGTSPPFVCLEGVPDAGARCISLIPFHGANCEDSTECSGELTCGSEPCPPRQCSHYGPLQLDQPHGECRFSCDPAVGCPAFGGLPHACLEDGGCYPGTFGVPCLRPSDCVSPLTCGLVPPDERARSDSPSICTAPCNEDADCNASAEPLLGTVGYCVDAAEPEPGSTGYCRPGAQPGRRCEKDAHCLYGCVTTESGARMCAEEGP